MAERYVKLTKDQAEAPLQDIRPGELNLPVHVPQLNVRRCSECGQELPESYVAPADEPWTSSIFDCMKDTDSCWTGLFCPCVLFGRNVERMREDFSNFCVSRSCQVCVVRSYQLKNIISVELDSNSKVDLEFSSN